MIGFGNNVYAASSVTFVNHDISVFMLQYMEPESKFHAKTGEISIGDNVFIGANSTILYNVKIGNNVIIGAGSIVTQDVPAGAVVVGNPARIIKEQKDEKTEGKTQLMDDLRKI